MRKGGEPLPYPNHKAKQGRLPFLRACVYIKRRARAQDWLQCYLALSNRLRAFVQVATAIRGAIILAKMSVVPVRRGYWGNKIGAVHTVPTKVTGKCGSVIVRLIPAPRGAGIVAARVPKKVLQMAGIEDVYTCSRGSTKTLGNFVKVRHHYKRSHKSSRKACAVHFWAVIKSTSVIESVLCRPPSQPCGQPTDS